MRDLPLWRGDEGDLHVVVETPGGSGIKLKYHESLGIFEWSRPLTAGVVFPHDYGFLPRTLSGDGDAVDALVLSDISSHPGVVVPARVVAALRIEQIRDGGPAKRNDRVLVVPTNEHRKAHIHDLGDLPTRFLQELESFFLTSLVLTGKAIQLKGWADAAEARDLVIDAAARFDSSSD